MFFGIEDALSAETADDIFDRANAYIRAPRAFAAQADAAEPRESSSRRPDDPADSPRIPPPDRAGKGFPRARRAVVPHGRSAQHRARRLPRLPRAPFGRLRLWDRNAGGPQKSALGAAPISSARNGCRVSDRRHRSVPEAGRGLLCPPRPSGGRSPAKASPKPNTAIFSLSSYRVPRRRVQAAQRHDAGCTSTCAATPARASSRPSVPTPAAIASATRSRSATWPRCSTRWIKRTACRARSSTRSSPSMYMALATDRRQPSAA